MRYTEYHCGVEVIKDKSLLSAAMEKLAEYENREDRKTQTEQSKPDFPVLTNNEKRKELYLLKPGYRYLNDCKSNESAIIEHLKNVQKGVK